MAKHTMLSALAYRKPRSKVSISVERDEKARRWRISLTDKDGIVGTASSRGTKEQASELAQTMRRLMERRREEEA